MHIVLFIAAAGSVLAVVSGAVSPLTITLFDIAVGCAAIFHFVWQDSRRHREVKQ
jgi:hypothetical protein